MTELKSYIHFSIMTQKETFCSQESETVISTEDIVCLLRMYRYLDSHQNKPFLNCQTLKIEKYGKR